MRRRYLAAFRPGGIDEANRRSVVARIGSIKCLALRHENDNLLVFAENSLPSTIGDNCIILGTVLDRDRSVRRTDDGALMRTAVQSAGLSLIQQHWGPYVALLPGRNAGFDVVRAPFCDLGCYHLHRDGIWLVASDAALLCQATGTPLGIEWDALTASLGRGEMMGSTTCLAGVGEVRGGDRCELMSNGRVQVTSLWSPWSFAFERHSHEREAVHDLRQSVTIAVQAAVSGCKGVLVMLSGGLDSSIVSSCLVDAKVPFNCMTLVSKDSGGDERGYARLTAQACGARLFEVDRDSAAVNMLHSSASMLPRPAARSFTQESERSTVALAIRYGAQAIVDGGGGDNVFCSHRSVAAVADCLLTAGFGPRFWQTASALGGLAEASLPTVAWRGVRRAWFRDRATRSPIETSLLAPEARTIAVEQVDHAWLSAPRGALPGKAVHIALLAVAQAIVESSYEPDAIARLSPLMSQPVVEACLRIPSWMWFAPGRDRAAARSAFASGLPAAVIDRRSKGSPNMFAAGLVDRNRALLREMLLDGLLASGGIVDRDAIRRLIDDPAPARSYQFTRLLRLADVEAWARHWC